MWQGLPRPLIAVYAAGLMASNYRRIGDFSQIPVPDAWKSLESGQPALCRGPSGAPYGPRKTSQRAIPVRKKGPRSMTDALKLGFGNFAAPAKAGSTGVLVVFCDNALKFGPATRKALGSTADLVAR